MALKLNHESKIKGKFFLKKQAYEPLLTQITYVVDFQYFINVVILLKY